MIYRGPSLLVVWLLHHPILGKLDRGHTGKLRKRDNFMTGERWRGWGRAEDTTARKPGPLQIVQYRQVPVQSLQSLPCKLATPAALLTGTGTTPLTSRGGNAILLLVMATLAKRKRTKASIMVFSSISMRSEHLRQSENYFRNEANTLGRTKIIFEAQRTRSIANQLFSKRKRTCPIVRKLFSKRSEHIIQKQKLFSKRSEHIRQKENYFRSEANTSSQ